MSTSEGGIVKGAPHTQGGVKFPLVGQTVELEGEEIVICLKAYESDEIFDLVDTPYNILMHFQKHFGCNTGKLTHIEPGEYVICKKVVKDSQPIAIKGTVREIINMLQEAKNCVVNMNGCTTGKCSHTKEDGGSLTSDSELATSNLPQINVKSCENKKESLHLPHFTQEQQLRMENKPVYVKNIGPDMPGMAYALTEQGRYVKFTDGSDGYFSDDDLIEITELPIQPIAIQEIPNLFELLPVKEYKLPKYKPFKTAPDDKTFMDIHADFTGDYLGTKLVLLGTHFDSDGATSLDAYKLLFTPYRGDKLTEFGNYCHTKKCFKHKQEVTEAKYYAYKGMVPRNSIRVSVNEGGLYNYLENAINFEIPDAVNHTIGIKISQTDLIYVIDAYNLLIVIKAMFELGHSQLEFAFPDDIDTPIIVYPAQQGDKVDKYETDFALIVTVGSYQNRSRYTSIINIETGCATFVDNPKEFCFDIQHMEREREKLEKKKLEEKLEETNNQVKTLKQEQIERAQRDAERKEARRIRKEEFVKNKADKKEAEELVDQLIKML